MTSMLPRPCALDVLIARAAVARATDRERTGIASGAADHSPEDVTRDSWLARVHERSSP